MSDTVWIRGSRRSRMNVSTRPSSSPRARLDTSATDLTGALALTGSCGSWITRPGVVCRGQRDDLVLEGVQHVAQVHLLRLCERAARGVDGQLGR